MRILYSHLFQIRFALFGRTSIRSESHCFAFSAPTLPESYSRSLSPLSITSGWAEYDVELRIDLTDSFVWTVINYNFYHVIITPRELELLYVLNVEICSTAYYLGRFGEYNRCCRMAYSTFIMDTYLEVRVWRKFFSVFPSFSLVSFDSHVWIFEPQLLESRCFPNAGGVFVLGSGRWECFGRDFRLGLFHMIHRIVGREKDYADVTATFAFFHALVRIVSALQMSVWGFASLCESFPRCVLSFLHYCFWANVRTAFLL